MERHEATKVNGVKLGRRLIWTLFLSHGKPLKFCKQRAELTRAGLTP
jgi:hypothetical protein